MKFLFKYFSLLILAATLLAAAKPAEARALLGISYAENSATIPAREETLAGQIEESFGNLVTVHNYNDHETLLKMLTRFNRLDAALITRQTYNEHNSASLIALAEVQVSGEAGGINLVLATHSYVTKAEQDHLVEGYQELLLSTQGLELLERYAMQQDSVDQETREAKPLAISYNKATKKTAKKPQNTDPKTKAPVQETTKSPSLTPSKFASDLPITETQPAQHETIATPQTLIKTSPVVVENKIQQAPRKKTASAQNIEDNPWTAHVDLIGKMGNERVIGEAGLFLPLLQTKKNMLFADLRFQLDDNSAEEGNFGLGYRQLFENYILGGYTFYDVRKTNANNTFRQWTLGAEVLTKRYDTRLNLYIADEEEKEVAGSSYATGFFYEGKHLLYNYNKSFEKPLSGFDAEIGGTIPVFNYPQVRAYAGGYYFNASGVKEVTGPKARLEVRFPDLFNWTRSLFELGAEVRDDSVRDTDYYVTARVRIPLGAGPKTQPSPNLSTLKKRMTERVVRDPDIITSQKETSGTETLTLNSKPIAITHVDDDGPGGSGTYEDPFGSLDDTAGSTDEIVLLHADSTFDGQSYQLADGQQLLGDYAGARHLIETDQLGKIIMPRATTGSAKPVIQNAADYALSVGNNSVISGLHIKDSTTGIKISGSAGTATLQNIDISGGSNGLSLEDVVGDIFVDSMNIAGATANGLNISGGEDTIVIAADIQSTTGNSVIIKDRTAGDVIISGTINDSGAGINVSDNTGGSITFSGSDKTIRTETNDAITLANNTDTVINFSNGGLDIDTTTGTGAGINILNNTGSTVSFTNGGMDIDTTTGTGLKATGGGTINIYGAGNAITAASGTALDLNGVAADMTFDNLSSTNSTASGIQINNISGAGLQVTGSTTVSSSTAAGISIQNSAADINFNDLTVASAVTDGLLLKNNQSGNFSVGTVNIVDAGQNGISLENNSGSLSIDGGSIDKAVSHAIKAINSSLFIDDLEITNVNVDQTIAGGIGIYFEANETYDENKKNEYTFSLTNSTIDNINRNEGQNDRAYGIRIKSSNNANISSGVISGIRIGSNISNIEDSRIEGYGINVDASDGSKIMSLKISDTTIEDIDDVGDGININVNGAESLVKLEIGDPDLKTPGDVVIRNTQGLGIVISAGEDDERGVIEANINAVDISSSNADSNIILSAYGKGKATYSVSNSLLDAEDSLYDNIYLLFDDRGEEDTPGLEAFITSNDLRNGKDDALLAENISDSDSLKLGLYGNQVDNGTIDVPEHSFILETGLGTITLYQADEVTSYSDFEDLLGQQNNTAGASGILEITDQDPIVEPWPDP